MREGLLAEVGDLRGCQFGCDDTSDLDLLTVGGPTWVNRLCIEWDLWTLGRATWVDMMSSCVCVNYYKDYVKILKIAVEKFFLNL